MPYTIIYRLNLMCLSYLMYFARNFEGSGQHGHTFQLACFTKNNSNMPEFNHLCSLDIVANGQLLHLWLNRFAEVSRLSIKEFSGDDSSPQQTSIYHQYILYPYFIYISHCQFEGNHPVSVEMFEGKCSKNCTKSCQMSTRTVLAVFTSKSVVIEISLTHLM